MIFDYLCNEKMAAAICQIERTQKENVQFPRNWLICVYLTSWILAHFDGSESLGSLSYARSSSITLCCVSYSELHPCLLPIF